MPGVGLEEARRALQLPRLEQAEHHGQQGEAARVGDAARDQPEALQLGGRPAAQGSAESAASRVGRWPGQPVAGSRSAGSRNSSLADR